MDGEYDKLYSCFDWYRVMTICAWWNVAISDDVSNNDIHAENLIKIKDFSSLEKVLLMTSYVLRFKNNALAKIRKTPYTKAFVPTKASKYAEKLWIYSNQRKINTSSKLSQLKKSLEIF